MKKKLLFVFGTRPEALKLAPVILKAKQDPRFSTSVCLTGQHREMVDQVLKLFQITPDYDLNIMQPGQTLGDLTARLFAQLDPVLVKVKPDTVIVQGDTTTAFAAALKAFYEKIPVAHVEAGLRSYNKYHPFPEEINRLMVSRIADFHFPPTREAFENLRREGIQLSSKFITGNTVVDALQLVRKRISGTYLPLPEKFKNRRIILVTAHRRENFGKPLAAICEALIEIVRKFPDALAVYPVHLNPEVQKIANEILKGNPSILLLPPMAYGQFIRLMETAYLILTDSGGIQEEAPSFGKPVLVLREVSERPDGIKLGVAKLVGTSRKKIVKEASLLLSDKKAYQKMILKRNPYGDGRASERILNLLAAK